MTNAEKYKEVFGMEVDPSMCPTTDCEVCPCGMKNNLGDISCIAECTYKWWKKEYKEVVNNG